MLGGHNKINRRFFVYGSLREGFFNYDKYLKGYVLSRELGTTKGDLYHIDHKGYPALVDGNRNIEGEVITVDNPKVLIKVLDKMENFYGFGNNNEYERVEKEVTLLNGKKEICYVYKYVEVEVKKFNYNYIHITQDSWKQYMFNR